MTISRLPRHLQDVFKTKTSWKTKHCNTEGVFKKSSWLEEQTLILIMSVLVMRHDFNIFKNNRIAKEIIEWFILSDENKWLTNIIKTLARHNSDTKCHLEDQVLHRYLLSWEALPEKNWTRDRGPSRFASNLFRLTIRKDLFEIN